MTKPVVTRFAPSPTGFLHIGGARTALFCWLYARHHGGQYLLRVEDTDRKRSTEEATAAIVEGLDWLGLQPDGDIVYQSQNLDRHIEVAQALLDSGNAYYCYCSREELAEMRETARAEGRPIGYDGTWRDRDAAEAPDGVDPVVRFKAPKDGSTTILDLVQGKVTVSNKELDDMIILRADGTPTYMLSVVVDDHDMGITHVIRGDDHLNNAFRQYHLFGAMGWDIPEFAHISLIHGSDGGKLSKRHGALGVDAYRDMGYLPDALKNYLVKLGWGHGDDEIFSTEQAIEWFDFDGVVKSAARFDFTKLEHINGTYMRQSADECLTEALSPFIFAEFGIEEAEIPKDKLLAAMSGLKERAKTLVELAKSALFLIAKRPLDLDEKAQKLLHSDAREMLARVLTALDTVSDWSAESLDAALRTFSEAEQLKFGKVAQPLRAALCGTTTSPGIFDVLQVLGREESLARIADQTTK